MRKLILIFLAACSLPTSAQLQKDQWLIGGSSLFSYSKSKELKLTSLQLSPSAGIFLRNKFAAGLRPGVAFDTYKYLYEEWRTSSISVAPFVRYYFLPIGNKINLLADAAFGYSWAKTKNFTYPSSHKYNYYYSSLMVGPSFFLNEHTALEVMASYSYISRGPIDTSTTHKLQIAIGLQFHLSNK